MCWDFVKNCYILKLILMANDGIVNIAHEFLYNASSNGLLLLLFFFRIKSRVPECPHYYLCIIEAIALYNFSYYCC